MKIKQWKWTPLAAVFAVHCAEAQTSVQVAHPSVAGNPLSVLLQVTAPQKLPSVTVDVKTQTPQKIAHYRVSK